MKIVHLCLSCFFIDNYSYQENMLPKYHVKMGHDVTVIASLFSFNEKGQGCYLPEPSVKMDPNGFKVIRLAYKEPARLNRFFRRYQGVYATLEQESPDLIFLHGLSMVENLTIIRYLKEHPKVKCFADQHGDFINSGKNFFSRHILHPVIWRYFVKKIEPFLQKCYGVTPMRCRFLTEVYKVNPEIVEFLPMGVDDDAIPHDRVSVRANIRKQLNIPEDAIVVLTGGKIDILKNTHILIEAFKKINYSKLHLIICGVFTPQMNYLKDELTENIHYLGWCNSEQVMNHMVASDLACFPGTHSTLWEQTVGVGLPAIFKRWNEMTHVDVDGNCVFVKGEDVDELQDVLVNFLEKDYRLDITQKAEAASHYFLYSNIAKHAIGV